MIELINYIKKSNFYHKEKPLQVTDIIKTQRELVRQGCPFLPTAFIEFLKYFNGIRASDSAILGIAPLDDKSLNIVDFNVRLNASKDVAILGYDDEVFLIYDGTEAYANGVSSEDRQVGTSAFNINYDDNTNDIISLDPTTDITITENYATYDFEITISAGKTVSNIEIISYDTNTVYLSITGQFERGKTYQITQDVYIL